MAFSRYFKYKNKVSFTSVLLTIRMFCRDSDLISNKFFRKKYFKRKNVILLNFLSAQFCMEFGLVETEFLDTMVGEMNRPIMAKLVNCFYGKQQ